VKSGLSSNQWSAAAQPTHPLYKSTVSDRAFTQHQVNYVFFDFFGTLVDYDASIHPTYNAPLAFARRAGCTISETASDAHWQQAWDHLEANAARTGREFSMHQVAQTYWRSIGAPSLAHSAIEILIGEYLDTWTQSVSPAEHAIECLTDLASDHRLTIVSNTHDPALVPRLARRFGLNTAVDRVISSVTVGWRKPIGSSSKRLYVRAAPRPTIPSSSATTGKPTSKGRAGRGCRPSTWAPPRCCVRA